MSHPKPFDVVAWLQSVMPKSLQLTWEHVRRRFCWERMLLSGIFRLSCSRPRTYAKC
jgi:hypothetical protein